MPARHVAIEKVTLSPVSLPVLKPIAFTRRGPDVQSAPIAEAPKISPMFRDRPSKADVTPLWLLAVLCIIDVMFAARNIA